MIMLFWMAKGVEERLRAKEEQEREIEDFLDSCCDPTSATGAAAGEWQLFFFRFSYFLLVFLVLAEILCQERAC